MITYLTVENVLEIHHYLINEFGGTHGLRDKKALESAINRPQSGYYSTLIEEATALMESLFINHPFIDGNKRIAFFCTDIFYATTDTSSRWARLDAGQVLYFPVIAHDLARPGAVATCQ